MNQKLLRNPDSDLPDSIKLIQQKIDDLLVAFDRERHFRKRRMQRFHPGMMREMLIDAPKANRHIGLQMILSMYREEFPWLYDSGLELIRALSSRSSQESKDQKIREFMDIVEFTSSHPVSRELSGLDKSS